MQMGKVKARIKTSFGEIIVEGKNPQEILNLLETFPEKFIEKVESLVSSRLVPSITQLKGVLEFTVEGPIIVTREKLTHYEAIGLILYASEEKKSTAAQIQKLMESSGIKSMVPARLNEMTKRGHVFKPDSKRPEFKLTIQGGRWIEDNVLARLRGKIA